MIEVFIGRIPTGFEFILDKRKEDVEYHNLQIFQGVCRKGNHSINV